MSESLGELAGRRQRFRRVIADVALDLFEQQGYDRTTMDQIADGADLSVRTLFRYVGAKEEAIFPSVVVDSDDRAAFDGEIPAMAPAMLIPALHYMVERFIWRHGGADQLERRFRVIMGTPALRARLGMRMSEASEAFAEGIAGGLGVTRSEAPRPDLAGRLLVGTIEATLDRWTSSGFEGHLETLLRRSPDDLADFLHEAIAPDPRFSSGRPTGQPT